MNLSYTSTLMLLSAIAIGLYLVFIGVRQKKRSPGLGMTHAGLALTAIIILFVEIFNGPTVKLNNAAALFLLLAIIGGGLVYLLHEKNRPPSMVAVVAHAIMGLIGFSMLLINII